MSRWDRPGSTARPGRPGRIRTAVDHAVASGPLMVAVLLLVVVAAIVVIAALVRWIVDPSEGIHLEMWQSFVRVFDAGSHGDDTTTWDRAVGVVTVLLGLVTSAVLLAIVVTAFSDTVERVRNGRFPLRSRPDTVILGWSHEIHTIITELDASPITRPDIAILSRRSRASMDESLRKIFGRRRGSFTVACRSGDRTDPADLDLVAVTDAERILVLDDPERDDDGDLVKTVFALMNHGVDPTRQRVIVEVADQHHAQIFHSVFGEAVEVVAGHEVLTDVLTQSMREKGFGQIFDQLTSYQHADLYEHPVPAAVTGASFGECLARCRDAIPVGIIRGGTTVLLPTMATTLEPGDRLLVLAEDNAVPQFGAVPHGAGVHDARPVGIEWSHQDILLVGWNSFAAPAVAQLRGFLAEGSRIDVVADATAMSQLESRSLQRSGHVDDVRVAESPVDMLQMIRQRLGERSFDAVSILPYRDTQQPGQADSRSLLYLAVVQDTVDAARTRVVCELRESRTADLVAVIEPDDLILSDALAASLIAQLTDRPWLTGVLADLFDFHGSALFAHPRSRWGFAESGAVRFGDVIVAAAGNNEIALGYRDGDRVVLAPDRDAEIELGPSDTVYVLGPALGWTGVLPPGDPPGAARPETAGPIRSRP